MSIQVDDGGSGDAFHSLKEKLRDKEGEFKTLNMNVLLICLESTDLKPF